MNKVGKAKPRELKPETKYKNPNNGENQQDAG
jgi:hypothetical protein